MEEGGRFLSSRFQSSSASSGLGDADIYQIGYGEVINKSQWLRTSLFLSHVKFDERSRLLSSTLWLRDPESFHLVTEPRQHEASKVFDGREWERV